MMNSPWAMLITPIWPNVNVSPRAMSSSTAPMLRPVKTWLKKHVHESTPLPGLRARRRTPRADRVADGPVTSGPG